MLAIEPCIMKPDLQRYLNVLGYSSGLVEAKTSSSSKFTRYTLHKGEIKNFRNVMQKNRNTILFSKPYDIETLRFSVLTSEISGITVDDSNIKIFRKAMLNLINYNKKIVEISLKSSSFVISRAISWGYKWSFPLIFSSFAQEFNEIWPLVSKINYLIVHGASQVQAYKWVLNEPFKLFSNE
ncbi:RNase P p30-like protein [Sulfuracidifex metallicus]|uniref:RNase P p30-like protein n=1 Tax=Sulfuracidifex metallicus TaxID=47303 RepID=UPI002272E7D7|nr:RNase P p30-like protein [Sulfuracidifex metallicus]MCY0849191.1 RNase P p30-like protein [Sulfuracidifex metallicus]